MGISFLEINILFYLAQTLSSFFCTFHSVLKIMCVLSVGKNEIVRDSTDVELFNPPPFWEKAKTGEELSSKK